MEMNRSQRTGRVILCTAIAVAIAAAIAAAQKTTIVVLAWAFRG